MDKIEAFSRQAAPLQAKHEDLDMYIGAARRSHVEALSRLEKCLQGQLPEDGFEESVPEQGEAGEQEETGVSKVEQGQEERRRQQLRTDKPRDIRSYFSMTRPKSHHAGKK